MSPEPSEADRARSRYFVMAGARLSGAMFAVIGIVLLGRATMTEQRVIGIAIVLLGLFEMAWLPRLLARRWRTPPVP